MPVAFNLWTLLVFLYHLTHIPMASFFQCPALGIAAASPQRSKGYSGEPDRRRRERPKTQAYGGTEIRAPPDT
ncbi:hypothetical protein SAMN04487911_12724 [Arenibacter nanhaiticus]|uniref:Uncharacterized protein n=1 Tax=Arenibacter nanhaiticus TaxID=558155 RepID=A0A1M6KQU1_9FLAO|nr:hypothetical protein SAMN04487911_12724 [Arenibacter nanhaiticus]